MSNMIQPQIILLRDGTDTSQGKAQIVSNIDACLAVADTIRTTLGPRGMDKLIYQDNKKAIVSNDGATIMKELQIVHPAASTLVDIAKSQDDEIGDGTTSVVLLSGEFMRQAKDFIDDGVHSQLLIQAYRKSCDICVERIKQIQLSVADCSDEIKDDLLRKCAATSLNSKLVASHRDFFAEMVVKAVRTLDDDLSLENIGIKQIPGGALEDSVLVEGVAFKKTFSYAGFEQQPKEFHNCKVLLLNVELELKSEKENAEVRVKDVSEFQSLVDAEWDIIYDKLDKIVKSGAKVVLSKLPIGDLATQYFSDRGMFCAGRVDEEDLKRVMKATGGIIQTSVNGLTDKELGEVGHFQEKQVGGDRYNFFEGLPKTKVTTLVLRGGGTQFIEETERSLHDSIMVVRRAIKSHCVVAGGGAIEMELSRYLREQSRSVRGKMQLFMAAYARALEVIPSQLSDNAGFDSTEILNQLRHQHASKGEEGRWYGVDIKGEGVCDTMKSFVWEPAGMKINAISAATEAACMILSVDETVKNPESEKPGQGGNAMPGRGGMGMGGRGGRGVRRIRGRGGR